MMGDSSYRSTIDCFAKTLKNDVSHSFQYYSTILYLQISRNFIEHNFCFRTTNIQTLVANNKICFPLETRVLQFLLVKSYLYVSNMPASALNIPSSILRLPNEIVDWLVFYLSFSYACIGSVNIHAYIL